MPLKKRLFLTFSGACLLILLFYSVLFVLLWSNRSAIPSDLFVTFNIIFILLLLANIVALTVFFKAFHLHIQKHFSILANALTAVKNEDLNYIISERSDLPVYVAYDEMRLHIKDLIDTLSQNEREINDIIRNISHDLKTPLTTIKGYAEGIIDGVADTIDKKDRYIKVIYSKANEMAVLIDELAYYSKYNVNSAPYIFSRVNISDYFKDCIDDLQCELEEAGFDFIFINNIPHNTFAIADLEQLKRVINNLVTNAMKYCREYDKNNVPNKKWIKFRISLTDDDYIMTEITDNGIGISPEALPRIFERMYRADLSRNSKISGSGLGLSITKKIINDHDGKIWCTSKLGEYTSIYFTLKKARTFEPT